MDDDEEFDLETDEENDLFGGIRPRIRVLMRPTGGRSSGLEEVLRPRSSTDEAVLLFERLEDAGAADLLEPFVENGNGDVEEVMGDLRKRGVEVPPRLFRPLLQIYEERVVARRQLRDLDRFVKPASDNPRDVVKAVAEAFTSWELMRFPDWFPAVHRWLLQWAVQHRHDEGVFEMNEVPESVAQQLLGIEFVSAWNALDHEGQGRPEKESRVGDAPGFRGGFRFERHVVSLFRKAGFSVQEISLDDHYGHDIIVHTVDLRLAITCQYLVQPCGLDIAQGVVEAMRYHDARSGIIVSPHVPTRAAEEYARNENVVFWAMEELERFAKEKVI